MNLVLNEKETDMVQFKREDSLCMRDSEEGAQHT